MNDNIEEMVKMIELSYNGEMTTEDKLHCLKGLAQSSGNNIGLIKLIDWLLAV